MKRYKAIQRHVKRLSDEAFVQMRGEYLSSDLLRIFRNSPEAYYRAIRTPESVSNEVDQLTTKLILGGEVAFKKDCCISDGPINPKTKRPFWRGTQAYEKWAMAQGKKIVSQEEFTLMLRLQEAVTTHAEAMKRLQDGHAYGILQTTLQGVLCQTRPDWCSSEYGIVDFKYVKDLNRFEYHASINDFVYDMAFERAIVRNLTGLTVPASWIVLEKGEPFRASVWEIPADVLDKAEHENAAAIDRLTVCRQTDTWPTGFEKPRVFRPMDLFCRREEAHD